MGDFLRVITEILHYIWPFRIVWSYQGGVRFRGGKPPKALKPGIYTFLPFFMRIEIINLIPMVIDLPWQSITTKDGKTLDLSVNFTYHVTDPVAHYANVGDFSDSFTKMAARHVMAKCRDWSYEEILAKQSACERSLRETLNTRIARLEWGAEIDDAGFTDLVLTKQFNFHR